MWVPDFAVSPVQSGVVARLEQQEQVVGQVEMAEMAGAVVPSVSGPFLVGIARENQ